MQDHHQFRVNNKSFKSFFPDVVLKKKKKKSKAFQKKMEQTLKERLGS